MSKQVKVDIDAWADGDRIPEEYAFCVPDEKNHSTMGKNLSPAIRWTDVPSGTKSFAIICHDPDVPSKADNVNKEGLVVPAGLARVDFCHWVLVDIPADIHELPKSAESDGIKPGGKPPGSSRYGLRWINSYTEWFASDAQMKGDYGGYDGPCPPWNDEIIHHYHFAVYALGVPSLGLEGRFSGPDALHALNHHVLAKGSWVGTYSLNPSVSAR